MHHAEEMSPYYVRASAAAVSSMVACVRGLCGVSLCGLCLRCGAFNAKTTKRRREGRKGSGFVQRSLLRAGLCNGRLLQALACSAFGVS